MSNLTPVEIERGEITLTQEERQLIATFRSMNSCGQEMLTGIAPQWQRIWPRHKPINLRLVVRGAAC